MKRKKRRKRRKKISLVKKTILLWGP